MSIGFAAAPDGVLVDLDPWRWRLALYLTDLEAVLGPEPSVPDHPLDALAASLEQPPGRPEDPVLARLLPDAVLDDPGAAAEFRRFTHDALLTRKRHDAAVLREHLGGVATVVDVATARSLLGALNDLRLMLGTRLAITEDGTAEAGGDLVAYATYDLLTALQYELVEILAGPRGDEAGAATAP